MNKNSGDILPKNWTTATIEDLIGSEGLYSDGDWIESKDQNPKGEVKLIQLSDIGDGEFKNKSNRFMSLEKAIEINCTFLKFGDILVARMPEPLGRATVFTLNEENKYVTVVDVAIIRTGSGIYNKYLMHVLNSPKIRKRIYELQTGTTRKRISKSNLNSIKIPVPPIEEQHRIVNKIEELFSELDNCIIQFETIKKRLKDYRNIILKDAFEGKLSKKWRENNSIESVDDILKKLKTKRHQDFLLKTKLWEAEMEKWRKPDNINPKPLKPKYVLPETCDLTSNIDGWTFVTLDEISNKITDGSHNPPPKKDFGLPMLSARNINNNKIIFEDYRLIDEELFESEYKRANVEEDDVLLTIVGTIGRACVVNNNYPKFTLQRSVALIKHNICSKYLCYYFQTNHFQKQLEKNSKGTAQKGIYLGALKKLIIPLCSEKEQIYIQNIIEEQFSLIDKLEDIISNSIQKSMILRQSILKKMIDGKIVKQEFTDNSIIDFLAKIKIERENYNIELREIKKKTPKRKKTNKMEKLTILELLTNSPTPISTLDAWKNSIHKENIDDFYAELKLINNLIEEIRDGKDIKLKLKNENR